MAASVSSRTRTDRRPRRTVEDILRTVDVQIDGARPWDIQVRDERFFGRVLADGALGLGEAYMDEWWHVDRLDELFHHLARVDQSRVPVPWSMKWLYLMDRFVNRQRRARAHRIAEHHYNLGNDLFRAMLDARMTYSCGYWKNATSLNEAQLAKLDLVCRKLDLRPGQVVLDIGCGWGSFIKYAAENYGITAVGITVSTEQVTLARELCAGLPVEVRLADYREVRGVFDHVVSIGMFEHVGWKNYRTFFEVVFRCLKDGGLFLLHTIASNGAARSLDAFTEKYIFPGGSLPSVEHIGAASTRLFVVEDWHNFGADYDPTLMAWLANFEGAWGELKARYGERFRRMWQYFLLSSAGSFRARRNNLWQIVFAKTGVPGGYTSVR